MIAEDSKKAAGKKFRSGDWYVSELDNALSGIQEHNTSLSDTQGNPYVLAQCITYCSPRYFVRAYGYIGLIGEDSGVGYSFVIP